MSFLISRLQKSLGASADASPALSSPAISAQQIAALPKFRYTNTLRERSIRLLKLEDGDLQHPIRCTLETRALDDHVVYEALSYVWGDPEDTIAISCNGQQLGVTRNLHAALVKMRMINNMRHNTPLWVDAICIDQKNLKEKAEQVQLMGEIYAKAARVHIWLRDVAEEDLQKHYEVVAMLKCIDEVIAQQMEADELDDLSDIAHRWVEAYCQEHGMTTLIEWMKILEIFMSEWCNRIWVIQESIRARAILVHVGSIITQWEIIFRVASTFAQPQDWGIISAPYARHMEGVHPLVMNAGSFFLLRSAFNVEPIKKLHHLARTTTTFSATDSRDKIYALVGLSDDAPHDFVDYNLSLREILINVARNALTAHERDDCTSLDYLSFVLHDKREDQDAATSGLRLPSWVADLTRERLPLPQTHYPLASLHGTPQVPEIRNHIVASFGTDESLTVLSWQIDEVQHIVEQNPYKLSLALMGSPDQYHDAVNWMARWMADVVNLTTTLQSYPGGTTIEQALAESIGFRGRDHPSVSVATIAALDNMKELISLLPFIQSSKTETEEAGNRLTPAPIKERIKKIATENEVYIRTFDRYSKWRHFCITRRGYFAWVPEAAQVGDAIHILQMCAVPFVLRPQGTRFTLIGDAYVHQHMTGEHFGTLDARANPAKLITIV